MDAPDLETGAGGTRPQSDDIYIEHTVSEAPKPDNSFDGSFDHTLNRISRTLAETVSQFSKIAIIRELQRSANSPESLPLVSIDEPATLGATDTVQKAVAQFGRSRFRQSQGQNSNSLSPSSNPAHDTSRATPAKEASRTGTIPSEDPQKASDRSRPSTEPPKAPYKVKIKMMLDWQLKEENETRKRHRAKWAGSASNDRDYLDDAWVHLWKDTRVGAKGLCQWPISDQKRKNLQLELVDALTSAPNKYGLDVLVGQGFRAMSSWISLIGVRLNELYSKQEYGFTSRTSPEGFKTYGPETQVQVLIDTIWICNQSRKAKIGNVLETCYSRAVLRQPRFKDDSNVERSTLLLRAHIRAVRIAIYLVNILYKHDVVPPLDHLEDLNEAWCTRVTTAEEKMRYKQRNIESSNSTGPFLPISDLNVKALHKIGQLQIRWTPYWDEHLVLETTRNVNVLKLYWFGASLSRYLLNM